MIFAIDVIVGFRKAYLNDKTGRECRDPKLIAIQYLKFYFWIDLLSGIPFDIITNNPFLRLVALIKIFRLFRLKKIITFLNMDAKSQMRIRVTYLIMTLVIINHWVACYFFIVAHDNWLKLNNV